jgi:diguanylate cyclase (GGDEF)-like protein
MKHIVDMTQAKGWSLYLYNEESNSLYIEKSHKKIPRNQQKEYLSLGEGIAGWVAQEGVPVIIPDIAADKRFSSNTNEEKFVGKNSIICVPLISKGKTLGALEVINKNREQPFTKEDLKIIMKLVDHASLAIERASLYQKMAELVITDDLTKLFNSRYLNRTIENEISRCDRYHASVSLIFLDIDFFKAVNDRYGHVVGSKVLVEMGQILIKGLRSVDIVSRYGGDEFVIVLPQTPPFVATQIAERLRKNINKHTFLKSDGLNLKLTASFGVASYPESAQSKDELLRLADEAMYKVKNRTRDGVYSISISN